MIYLNNITDSQIVLVPRVGELPSGSLVLVAKNTMENEVQIEADAIDLETMERYINIAVALPSGLADGEYEYSLLKGEVVISTGLLVLVSSNSSSQYNKEITYEQYNN